MIRAEELLGLVRPPNWHGPSRVVLAADDELAQAVVRAVERRREAAAAKRAAAAADRPLWVEIGAAIHAARARKRHMRKVAGRLIGTSPQSLDDYEAGVRPLPDRCWPAVLEAYGIDIAARVAEWGARD